MTDSPVPSAPTDALDQALSVEASTDALDAGLRCSCCDHDDVPEPRPWCDAYRCERAALTAEVERLRAENEALTERRDGPGTPSARLHWLAAVVEQECPGHNKWSSSETGRPEWVVVEHMRALTAELGRVGAERRAIGRTENALRLDLIAERDSARDALTAIRALCDAAEARAMTSAAVVGIRYIRALLPPKEEK